MYTNRNFQIFVEIKSLLKSMEEESPADLEEQV